MRWTAKFRRAVLEDEGLVATVYEAVAKRHRKSRSRGRGADAAEMVLRLLILKHIGNWSYETLDGAAGTRLRPQPPAVKLRVLDIARAARS